jgi:signal transduction histidine kinase
MKSMRQRLTWWLVTTTILLVICASATLYIYVRSALIREFDAGLFAKAQGLASLLRIERDGRYDLDLTDQSLPEYRPSLKPEYFQIFIDGQVLEQSQSLTHGTFLVAANAVTQKHAWNLALPNHLSGRAAAVTTKPQPEDENKTAVAKLGLHVPDALIVVARDRTEVDRILDTLLSSLLVASVVSALSCFASVQIIVQRGLRPVNRLATQASAIGPDTLNQRFDSEELPEELQPISTRLNDLLERLDSAFQRQRRLNSDISHELRTPIAELRTLTEVAVRWPADASTTAAYFHDAREIALKMESLIEMLLALARSQSGTICAFQEQIDLSEILRAMLPRYEDKIREKSLTLKCTVPECADVYTNKFILSQIFQNLLANAVEYTPQNGSIGISLEQMNGSCQVKICNSNDSIQPEDIPRLFESFWRKDTARSDRSHAGLGLTLVGEYAKQLRMKIEPRLPEPDRFEIVLWISVSRQAMLTDQLRS